MAELIIDDLNLTGLDLLQDQESFLNEVNEAELSAISGGNNWEIPPQKGHPIKIGDSSQFAALSVYPPRIVCIPC